MPLAPPRKLPQPSLFATAFAVIAAVLPAIAAAEPAAPPGAVAGPAAPPVPPPPPPLPVAGPAAPETPATASAAEAAAALRATQELESRLVQISGELAGLEKQRASWEDIRRRLDELAARLDGLAQDLRGVEAHVEAAPPAPAPALALAPPAGLLSVGERGILLRSPDGSFLLRPRLRLQVRYEGALVDRGPGELVARDSSSFVVRHAEALFEGYVLNRRFEYRLQLDFTETPLVQDAFVQWRFRPAVVLRAGQFKVPFGFQRQVWSAYYEFVDLSEAMNAFSLERDVGVMIAGRQFADRLSYQLAVTNGAGQGKVNDNIDLAYSLRVVAAPFGPLPDWEGDPTGHSRPLLAIGGSAYYSLVPTDIRARTGNPLASVGVDGRVDNVEVWQGGVELRAIWRGAALQAEYFQRHEHPGIAAADRDSHGAYAQASYFVIPGFLQLAARAGRSDLPLYGATLAERQLRGNRVDEQSGAVNAYLRRHDVKLQVDYSHLRSQGVAAPGGIYAPDTHRVRAQIQLMF